MGRLLALTVNVTLGLKGQPGTNTLPYLRYEEKKLVNTDPDTFLITFSIGEINRFLLKIIHRKCLVLDNGWAKIFVAQYFHKDQDLGPTL